MLTFMFRDPDLFIYFDLDVEFRSYPVSNKVNDCSFPTVLEGGVICNLFHFFHSHSIS